MKAERGAGQAILGNSTPVVFRGHQGSARVVSVGINPSVREFRSRSGGELDGHSRRFETLSSLGVTSMNAVTEDMDDRIHRRCLDYFQRNPYLEWFAPMEHLIHGITGASFFDGSAYHLDLVHWPTDPLWGQLGKEVRQELLNQDRTEVMNQLRSPALEVIYLNGKTVCDEVGGFLRLTSRPAKFRERGSTRRFHCGRHGNAMVVGCSSNIQEERVKSDDRADFMDWIVAECRKDLKALRADL